MATRVNNHKLTTANAFFMSIISHFLLMISHPGCELMPIERQISLKRKVSCVSSVYGFSGFISV